MIKTKAKNKMIKGLIIGVRERESDEEFVSLCSGRSMISFFPHYSPNKQQQTSHEWLSGALLVSNILPFFCLLPFLIPQLYRHTVSFFVP